MNNIFDDFRAAVAQAKTTLNAADSVASSMAGILRGRLRRVDRFILVELKRELQGFNAHTKEWAS